MTQASIRSDLKTALDGVTNIGLTYDYGRWTAEWDTFLTRFKTTIGGVDQIRAWMVEYAGIPKSEQVQFNDVLQRTHDFRIRGVLGLDDSAATEKTMAALAESVCNALDDAASLSSYYDAEPARMPIFEVRKFGSALCHYVEIVQRVTENRA